MEDLKLAILIDADNISPKYVKVILDEAASFGVAACKREPFWWLPWWSSRRGQHSWSGRWDWSWSHRQP